MIFLTVSKNIFGKTLVEGLTFDYTVSENEYGPIASVLSKIGSFVRA